MCISVCTDTYAETSNVHKKHVFNLTSNFLVLEKLYRLIVIRSIGLELNLNYNSSIIYIFENNLSLLKPIKKVIL